ncbi:MAG: manganese efflux pump [Oscillospiraceae bacterium]|nr:manganese efflux pump [Oscillospiraceae bacterium]
MLSVLLIGISLSMDAFAVTVANAVTLRPFRGRDALWSAVYFGGFQFLMPLAGALLAGTVSGHLMKSGPFISFVMLGYIGVKMILDAVRPEDENAGAAPLDHRRLLALAVATSIDALAVGVSFAFSPPAPGLWPSCALIGCVTFLLTLLASFLGGRLQKLHPRKAGVAGGAVLLFIGLRILLSAIL